MILYMEIINTNDITNGLVLMFLAIMGSFSYKILACPMQKLLSNNIIIRNLAYVTLILFTTTFMSDNKLNPIFHFIKAFIIYIFIIITTKMTPFVTSIIFSMLLIIYTSNMYIKYFNNKINSNDKEKKYIVSEEKNNTVNNEKINLKNKINILEKSNKILLILVLIITVYGFINFTITKNKQYGKKFSLFKFLLGVRKCNYE
jgi:hypothetical protein